MIVTATIREEKVELHIRVGLVSRTASMLT